MIGNKLKLLRESKQLSRAQIADVLKISERTYIKYENNESYPSHEIILNVANYYNVNPQDLEYGVPKMVFENKDNTSVQNQGYINQQATIPDTLQLLEVLKDLQTRIANLEVKHQTGKK